MIDQLAEQTAHEMFAAWYEYCLSNGIEPEQIVSEFGDMMLITDSELIERIEKLAEG
jgi:hypothetical protein